MKGHILDHCIKEFKKLCGKAFSPRELKRVPVLGKLAMVNHGSVYKTRLLESILKSPNVLGENGLLFGGPDNPRLRGRARVAVTTTDQTSKQWPTVIANYNRPREAEDVEDKCELPSPTQPASFLKKTGLFWHLTALLTKAVGPLLASTSTLYDFFREAMPSGEMKIWEA